MGRISCFNLAVFYPLSFRPAALDGRPKNTFSPSVPVAPTATLVGTCVEPLLRSLMKVCVCMGIPFMKKAVSVQFESGAVRPAFHPLQTFNSCSKLETLL